MEIRVSLRRCKAPLERFYRPYRAKLTRLVEEVLAAHG
jgi:N-formylglutamate amidohydrolase